jgi:hypothetical protein
LQEQIALRLDPLSRLLSAVENGSLSFCMAGSRVSCQTAIIVDRFGLLPESFALSLQDGNERGGRVRFAEDSSGTQDGRRIDSRISSDIDVFDRFSHPVDGLALDVTDCSKMSLRNIKRPDELKSSTCVHQWLWIAAVKSSINEDILVLGRRACPIIIVSCLKAISSRADSSG